MAVESLTGLMQIRDRETLATSPARSAALDIIEAGINRVLPASIMAASLTFDAAAGLLRIQGDSYHVSGSRIFVVGGGKAAGLMAEALEAILPPEMITAGVVTDKGGGYKLKKIKAITAGHPLPDERGEQGVREMLRLKTRHDIRAHDLVLALLSGGGSALLPYPVRGVTLADQQRATEMLLASGAAITEVNTVRKHLSRVKGGRLGLRFAPATVISLVLSDVIGDDLASIASGPTYPDPSTFAEAWEVLERYGLTETMPESVQAYLRLGIEGKVPETPKQLNNCRNYIIGNSRLALEAMARAAEAKGYCPRSLTAEQQGETTAAALQRAAEIKRGDYRRGEALLLGGETTPRLPPNPGRGGRNQHYAAVTLTAMRGYPGRWVMASAGTDGTDFLPDVAGAIVDQDSLSRAEELGLDVKSYLDRYDSHTLLAALGDALIITGNTGTNVGDIIVYLLEN